MSWLTTALEWMGIPTGAQDGDNLRTGQITTERSSDSSAGVEALALGLSATWACVNFWAGNIASLPLTIYRNGPSGVPVEARDHPLFALLHDSPNYDQSAFEVWEFMQASLELRGNAYAEIERRSDNSIVSLTPIVPGSVTVRRLNDGDLQYRWAADGIERVARQANVLHIRGSGGGPLGGLSPLSICRRAFTSAVDTDRAAGSLFANGARPSGVLSTDKVLTPEQRKLLEEILQEKFVGAANAGRPMVLDNALKWEQLSMSPDDAQLLESRQFSVEDICRVFEVDPHMVGHTAGNTQLGSSISDQTLSLLKFKMRKRLKRNESTMEKQFLTAADRQAGVSIKYNIEGFLRADSIGRAKFYEIMKQFMTKNEIRALEGLGPVDGGDVLMTQMQDVPLARALAEPRRTGNEP